MSDVRQTEVEQAIRTALVFKGIRLHDSAIEVVAARVLAVVSCEGQPPGEPSCDEKINYWIVRHREACEQLEQMRAELRAAEPVLVAADRIREAYEAMTEGRDVGRLADWERPS